MINRATRYFIEDANMILKYGYKDENPRPKYADGTSAYTISVNQNMRRYDLSNGDFPINMLRPIAWKSAIKEIFAIYQNQSNKISEFERCGCKWWKDWELEDGTIGKSYPYNLESHRPNEMKKTVVKVERRLVKKEDYDLCELPHFPKEKSIDDKIYFGRYTVIEKNIKKDNDNKHRYSMIQFIDNGYKMPLRNDSIGLHKCVNPYERTVFNVGYLGELNNIRNFEKWEIDILKTKWMNMLKRCYSKKYQEENNNYNNVFVHNRWHCFANFLEDIRYVPQYFLAKEDKFENWQLDKDYYGSNAYSKDTCVFLKLHENVTYARTKGCYEITDKDNNKYYDLTIAGFSDIANLNLQKLRKAIKNDEKFSDDEFVFKFIPNTDEYVYRYELSRNQVNELINGIKTNPYGRRHVIDFWNWANIDKKALVECAFLTMWNVRTNTKGKNYLDMTLIQRSGDMLVASGGGGVNEVQYAALLMMIARHCGLLPGVFVHFVQNEQIYDRHIEQAEELQQRYSEMTMNEFYHDTTYKTPKLILSENAKDFYSMTIDDFEMVDYEPIKPQLKLELGI